MRKRAKWGQSIFQCTPLFQTQTFVLLCLGFVCSQALEYFIEKLLDKEPCPLGGEAPLFAACKG